MNKCMHQKVELFKNTQSWIHILNRKRQIVQEPATGFFTLFLTNGLVT